MLKLRSLLIARLASYIRLLSDMEMILEYGEDVCKCRQNQLRKIIIGLMKYS